MQKKFLFLVFLGSVFITNSQQSSLAENKKRVDSLFFTNQVEGLEVSERMLPKAYASKDTFYITYFLDQAGELNRMVGNYDRAIEQMTKCLTYKVNWKDLQDLSLTYNNLGKAYVDKGLYTQAAQHFLKALELMEEDKNLMGQAYYLNNLGALYDLQHNYTKAISYYSRSLHIKVKLNDRKGIAATHTNLGISYFNLGNYEAAIAAYDKSAKIYRELNIPSKVARSLSNQGKVYLELKEYEDARRRLVEALRLKDQFEEPQLTVQIYNTLSEYYLSVQKSDSALFYNQLSMDLAKQINGFKPLRDSYRQRAKLYQSAGQYERALEMLEKSIQYDDSLINEVNIYAVADMEGKYNYEKNLRTIKEQELEQALTDKKLKEKRLEQVLLVLGLVIVTGAAFFYYLRNKNMKRKNELLEGQNKLISLQKKSLEQLNERVTQEVNSLQITVDEKEKLLDNVFAETKNRELPPEILALSKREMEVLCNLALGRTDEQIATSLFVSKSTVKTHLRRIYSKLLVSGRAEAVAIAHKHDLLK